MIRNVIFCVKKDYTVNQLLLFIHIDIVFHKEAAFL